MVSIQCFLRFRAKIECLLPETASKYWYCKVFKNKKALIDGKVEYNTQEANLPKRTYESASIVH